MADQTLARYVNERGILTLLRVHGPSSRADMARQLSLTPATVTRLVTEMIERGLVREEPRGAARAGREPGRPAVAVALAPEGAYFLGVEIGVGVLRFALLDLAAKVTQTAERIIPRATSPEMITAMIADELAAHESDPRFSGRIRSVGVTVPGLVTLDGYVVHLPILGWRELNLRALLAEAIPLPAIVENNATAAAFGAVYTQPELPSDCTIFLKLGTGLGGAAIINGRLLRGGSGTAGEFGHVRIADNGPRCSCGQVGCLETFVNLAALARLWRSGDETGESDTTGLPGRVAEAAENDDPNAVTAIDHIAERLGRGIVSLVNIFNPSTIVLGGVMRPVIERMIPVLEAVVASGIVPGMRVPDIRLSALGLHECAIGAATIAHHRAFDLSNFDLADGEA
ncbi:Sugar kinase of the NBD/HSP70 family, may contain an N-terminal HTH domain [Kaistia soli DSM 19436]|uniref:Sugar kinase of the NBD/HSP70 family, may contain an N-terminal HTH domain n=1 Tax=Kaistia soli DSM 19436 TaxID=1122133 RepID=A0A1M5FXA1_9HYPH|nr:ROK family transcriptional regulator [Kaistia soli]SHF96014.1 Sugar kinase of the NBD/HSP70 family, may contain an N-terminal HTH domain [Kaistia soli DSM 19436]